MASPQKQIVFSPSDEKKKSVANKGEILDARIVANYGDPGLDEDYGFDILSRFLIVSIESPLVVPMQENWYKRLVVVFRPENLWINAEEGLSSSPSSQKRSDAIGNINQGLAGSPTTNGITRISSPYQINEKIKIKRLAEPVQWNSYDPSFNSVFALHDDQLIYKPWHMQGSTFPFFSAHPERILSLRAKTLFRPDFSPTPWNRFGMTLYKSQYEAFFFYVAAGYGNVSAQLTAYAENMFGDELNSNSAIYNANGGYVFRKNPFVSFMSIDFIDLNITNKQRISTNECMPLIVTVPNSFPTPKARTLGTIAYNPTYATIIKQS